MSAVKLAADNAFLAAKDAGLSYDECCQRREAAKLKVRADLAVDDPTSATINALHRRQAMAVYEAARLRRERDALLVALADALNVSESEAWLIARLDMEDEG